MTSYERFGKQNVAAGSQSPLEGGRDMLSCLWAKITHRERRETTERTLFALRERTQIAENERVLIQRSTEKGDPTWLERALLQDTMRRSGGERL